MLFKNRQKPQPKPPAGTGIQNPSVQTARLVARYDHAVNLPIELSVFSELVRRWDAAFPDWRRWQDLDGRDFQRPVNVLAVASNKDSSTPGRCAVGLVDVASRCRRGLAYDQATIHFDMNTGNPLYDRQIQQYLGRTGIVITVGGIAAGQIDPTSLSPLGDEPTPVDLTVGPEKLSLDGQLRLFRFLLLQFGQVLYADPSSNIREVLFDELQRFWNPLFAWHVDIWRELTAGADRFRYSSPGFTDHALPRLEAGLSELQSTGIFSKPLLFWED